MAGAIPEFTEEDVRDLVDAGSFERGRRYFERGMILNPRRQQGAALAARCQGSYDNTYRVEVTFDGEGIATTSCSCPIGGYCKHVVALLLTWLDDPEGFTGGESVAALERRTKAELVALIRQMLRRDPDLEDLLDVPLPTPGKKQRRADAAVYRRQAESALRQADYGDWRAGREAAMQLSTVAALGGEYTAQDDYANAVSVYEGVAEAVMQADTFYDEEGAVTGVLVTCVAGLGRCLEHACDDAALREEILRALFAIFRYDHDVKGGVDLSADLSDIMRAHATAEERHLMAQWVREALAGQNLHSYSRQAYGDLLLDLEEDTLDDEAFITICRETGRTYDLIDRLLAIGRVDEAMAETAELDDYQLLQMADLFVRHARGAMGEALIRERGARSDNIQLVGWLKERYKSRGDDAGALDLARAIFRKHPTLEGYQEIRALAQKRDRWEALRPQLRMFLSEGKHIDLLARIYLDEGEIDHALDALRDLQTSSSYGPGYTYYGYTAIELDVARAAEKKRPDAALEVYKKRVEQLIAMQGRENYQTACGLLKRIRSLYEKKGETDAWTAYIFDLRERNRRLRALMDELSRASLV